MLGLLNKCLRDENGGEVLEYALVLGLIVIGSLGLMSALGIKVMAKWQSLQDSF
jgi:Flp pilus assembly pilin Flp